MKSFRFPLERVLRWRQTQLELEEGRLRQHAAALADLDRLRRELEQAGTTAETEVRRWQPVAGSDLAALDGFRRHLRRQAHRLAEHRAARQRLLDEQQKVLLEARRKYRLLERLRERRLAEWQAEADREAEALAAESYLTRLVRESGFR